MLEVWQVVSTEDSSHCCSAVLTERTCHNAVQFFKLGFLLLTYSCLYVTISLTFGTL